MSKEAGSLLAAVVFVLLIGWSEVWADVFGVGENQFTIDFVAISGDASSADGTNISQYQPGHDGYKAFVDPCSDYRIGVFEITNNQWDIFRNSVAVPVTGAPADAYDRDSTSMGLNVPTDNASWYEAAQFVNWLNTSRGYHAAYRFTGTQGTSDYTPDTWSVSEADNGTNLYRHKDAFYHLPTEDEWVKAAYWNGSALQTWATCDNVAPTPGVDSKFADAGGSPWDVGSGSEELNGTYDMMGNVWEWMESPASDGDYEVGSSRPLRGGAYNAAAPMITPNSRVYFPPNVEGGTIGFRVASDVPEPCTLGLLVLGGLMMGRRKY